MAALPSMTKTLAEPPLMESVDLAQPKVGDMLEVQPTKKSRPRPKIFTKSFWPGYHKRIVTDSDPASGDIGFMECLRFKALIIMQVGFSFPCAIVVVWELMLGRMSASLPCLVFFLISWVLVCKYEKALSPMLYTLTWLHSTVTLSTLIRQGGVDNAILEWGMLSLAITYPFITPRASVGITLMLITMLGFIVLPICEAQFGDLPNTLTLAFEMQIGIALANWAMAAAIFWYMFTSFVEAKRVMQVARDEAIQARHTQANFLAKMSHEVRTPVSGLIGMLEVLEDDELSPETHEKLRHMSTAASSLKVVIDDILKLSKIGAERESLVMRPLALRPYFQDCFALFEACMQQKNLETSIVVDPSLPQYVLGDTHQLQQMFNNYLNNAIKFTHLGSIKAVISMVQETPLLIKVEVLDTGIGVPEDRKHLLFQMFSQADESTNRRYGGTGLGLSIVRGLAQLMGGDAGMVNRPTGGSCFWFTFSATCTSDYQGEEASITAVSKIPPVPEKPVWRLPLRVIVVDDIAVNVIVAREMLKRIDVVPICFHSGKEALEYLKNNPNTEIHLVLTDIWMPEMDGLETTRAILDLRPGLKVVGLSADLTGRTEQLALDSGISRVICKPLGREAIYDLCKEVHSSLIASKCVSQKGKGPEHSTSTPSQSSSKHTDDLLSRSVGSSVGKKLTRGKSIISNPPPYEYFRPQQELVTQDYTTIPGVNRAFTAQSSAIDCTQGQNVASIQDTVEDEETSFDKYSADSSNQPDLEMRISSLSSKPTTRIGLDTFSSPFRPLDQIE